MSSVNRHQCSGVVDTFKLVIYLFQTENDKCVEYTIWGINTKYWLLNVRVTFDGNTFISPKRVWKLVVR